MLVDLRKLKPNPFRDLAIDPVDQAKVAELKASIKEDGYWGGIVARRRNGDLEIAAGHHRVHAAVAAGIREAEIYVGDDIDDAGMVRIYARENATQRGNTATAQAGSVAAAVRVIAKIVLTGTVSREFSRHSLDILRGHVGTDRGLGHEAVEDMLSQVPGCTDYVIKQQLANLKSSGHYARILGEVKEEIEEENRVALKALERAEKDRAEAEARERTAEAARKEATAKAKAAREEADRTRAALEQQRTEAEAKLAETRRAEAEAALKQFDALRQTRDLAEKAAGKSAEREVTFDFEGVAQHFKNAHQIDVFRQLVTGDGITPYLPVKNQAGLAKQMVALAKTRDAELTGGFIREHVMTLVIGAKTTERRWTKADREDAARRDLALKAKQYQHDFARGCSLMIGNGVKLRELLARWPKGHPFPVTAEFRNAVKAAKTHIDYLERRI